MREIKFRQFCSEEDNHQYGYVYFDLRDGGLVIDGDWSNAQQFTGLKDKNGKEIYEGDILKSKPLDLEAEVTYLDSMGGFYPFINDNIWKYVEGSMFKTREWEIIGNIYENPELLTPEGK